MDRLAEESIVALHPDSLLSQQRTAALRRLMVYYGSKYPTAYWARLVGSPLWREQRSRLITVVAEQDWLTKADALTALQLAEQTVLAAEACAGQWDPDQCRITTVRIDGKLQMSLVCSVEGSTR